MVDPHSVAVQKDWPTIRGLYLRAIPVALAPTALAGLVGFAFGGAEAALIAVVLCLVLFAAFYIVGYAKLRARSKAR